MQVIDQEFPLEDIDGNDVITLNAGDWHDNPQNLVFPAIYKCCFAYQCNAAVWTLYTNNTTTPVPNVNAKDEEAGAPPEVNDKDEDDDPSDAGTSGGSIQTETVGTVDKNTSLSGGARSASVSVLAVVALNWALFVIAVTL